MAGLQGPNPLANPKKAFRVPRVHEGFSAVERRYAALLSMERSGTLRSTIAQLGKKLYLENLTPQSKAVL